MSSLSAALTTEVGAAPLWQRLVSFSGPFVMVGIAWLFSRHRDRIPWRVVSWGIGLQLSFGVLVMKTDLGLWLFSRLNDLILALLRFTAQGTEFVFGDFASEKFAKVMWPPRNERREAASPSRSKATHCATCSCRDSRRPSGRDNLPPSPLGQG